MQSYHKIIGLVILMLLANFANAASADGGPKLKALIVDGQNNHAWKQTTPVLKCIFETSGLFRIDIATAPESGPMDSFKPAFSKYDVIVLNYNGTDWCKAAQDSFVDYVKSGGGVVVIHAADNSFPLWKEYNEMIGIGGWGGRNEKSGPMVRYRDGKTVFDNSPGDGGTHGPGHNFQVIVRDINHPITKGLPLKWLHASDELYSKLRGPAKNMTVLATAYADPKFSGTGENEPMLMTITYGEGRIFHTVLGHDNYAMDSVDFIVTCQRGAEWAATGKVTQPLPADFPSADKVSLRPFDELVTKITSYKCGQGRIPLAQIEELVRGYQVNDDMLTHVEGKFDQILASDATFDCKHFICRQLGLIGSYRSIPVLTKMAADPNLTDIALYALQCNPDGSVDTALAQLLPQTSTDRQKIAIINTLGIRKNAVSLPVILRYVNDANEIVALSAIQAAGNIGADDAVAALNKTRPALKSAKLLDAVAHAHLHYANQLASKGSRQQAFEAYASLYEPNQPAQIRTAALNGMIFNTDQDPGILILETLMGSDVQMKLAAVMMLNDVKTGKIAEISAALPVIDNPVKVAMLAAFAKRGDLSVHDQVVELARSNDQNVRVAAIRALASLGNESDVMLLASLAVQYNDWQAAVIRESLAQLKSPKANDSIINALVTAGPNLKIELINAIRDRNIVSAVPVLLKEAQCPDAQVRVESYKALRILAGPEMLAQLIDMLLVAQPAEQPEAQRTVVGVAQKIVDPNIRSNLIVAAYSAQTNIASKVVLISVLAKCGDSASLAFIRNALEDPNSALKNAAIHALADWPNMLASDDLLKLARGTDLKNKILALRGYVRLLTSENMVPREQACDGLKCAMSLAAGESEKKMVLSGLAKVKHEIAMEFAAEYLSDPALVQEAGAAVVAIAPDVIDWKYERTKTALEKVLQADTASSIKASAREILDKYRR